MSDIDKPNPTKRPSHTRKLGVLLILSPIILVSIASAWLYIWIVSNGYQGELSMTYVFMAYAVMFLAYYGPIVLILSAILVVIGSVLIFSKK